MPATELPKGANHPLPTGEIEVVVSWSSRPSAPAALDVCALRLGPDGNVRADDDFVFFNAPRTRDGSLEHPGPASPDTATAERIRVDLAAQPDTVDRIVVTATIDTATPELTFADVRDVAVDVLPVAGRRRHARRAVHPRRH